MGYLESIFIYILLLWLIKNQLIELFLNIKNIKLQQKEKQFFKKLDLFNDSICKENLSRISDSLLIEGSTGLNQKELIDFLRKNLNDLNNDSFLWEMDKENIEEELSSIEIQLEDLQHPSYLIKQCDELIIDCNYLISNRIDSSYDSYDTFILKKLKDFKKPSHTHKDLIKQLEETRNKLKNVLESRY